ncbi:hypothetical protein J6590_038305 [Homalodisca vitripennis]|nr:hypothetical protein J6590_038305 [Homalodisca vitripennis]
MLDPLLAGICVPSRPSSFFSYKKSFQISFSPGLLGWQLRRLRSQITDYSATTSFSTTTISDGRKRLSGAEYKKRAKKKLEEQERVLKQTKRLDLFFKTPGEQEIAPVLEGPALDDSVDETASQLDDNVSAGPSCSNPPANLANLNEDIIIPHEIATESLSLELLSPCCSSEDPAFWVLNDATRDSIAKNGFKQNIDLDFSNSVREYKDQNDIYPNLCFNEH